MKELPREIIRRYFRFFPLGDPSSRWVLSLPVCRETWRVCGGWETGDGNEDRRGGGREDREEWSDKEIVRGKEEEDGGEGTEMRGTR